MKKNYAFCLITTVFLFSSQLTNAQIKLEEDKDGSLIKNWLDKNKSKYNLSENDLSSLLVSDSYFSKKSRLQHVYVNQSYQGIKIHNAISSVAVRDNDVFYYANGLVQNISSKINTVTPLISPQSAINAVATAYNLGSVSNLSTISQTNNNYVFSNGNVSQKDIPVTLVFQKTLEGSLNLAWDLNIFTLSGKNWYSVRVDALNGQILESSDWVVSCNFQGDNHTNHTNHTKNTKHLNRNANTIKSIDLFKSSNSMMVDGSSYNVLPIPIESPNHGSVQLITEPANLNASPFGWHDTDGVAGADFTYTRGNNAWSQDDLDGNLYTGGSSPEGTASLTFDFPLNLDQEPIGYLDASLTNLFYMNNIMHDVWYQYGFDEVSGNFQENNYGNGGAEADYVLANGQDGLGLNNALFVTPPDGLSPIMIMFLWTTNVFGEPLTINNGALAGDYFASTAVFGAQLPTTPITSDIVLVIDDNIGDPASTDTADACNLITNASAISGKIAIVRAGVCDSGTKVLAAESAGAIAVIIVNDSGGTTVLNMITETVGNQVTIPSIMVSENDGNAMITALENGETVNASLTSTAPYRKDSNFDATVVAHEYGHGVSFRLAGGPSASSCLLNEEQMGEGWSDWMALMITMKATDVAETGRGIATYSLDQPVDGVGIRPYSYSTDTTINPLTYDDTNDVVNISKPHGIGTVWATILWDLTWAYIDRYGFDSDIYNGSGGNNKVMYLVIEGLKLQECESGFVGARDAILAADNALMPDGKGENQCLIWEVFAARGVGVNASDGLPSSRTDQIEDFTLLPASDPSLDNCPALSVDEVKESNYSIFPNPTNDILNIEVKKSFGNVTMTLADVNGRVVLSKNTNLSSSTELNINALQSGMYILTIKGENIYTNDKILKN